VKLDSKSGQLSYEGKPGTKMEKGLATAIDDHKVKVNLKTADENIIEGKRDIEVGLYGGSETVDGIEITLQYINIKHAKIWHDAGGSDIGGSVLHEINESYMGAKLHPGQGFGFNEDNYNEAHEAVKTMEGNQYYPIIIKHIRRGIDDVPHKVELYDENDDIYFPLWEEN
jgi:hypothetical protein